MAFCPCSWIRSWCTLWGMYRHRIVCLGDSITASKSVGVLEGWPALLQLHLQERGPWCVYNRGVSGETVRQGLDRLDKDVLPLLPAIVLIEFGLNDSSFRPKSTIPRVIPQDFRICLQEITERIRSGGGKPILVINHPLGRPDPILPNRLHRQLYLARYHAITRTLAKKKKYPLLDLHHRLKAKYALPWQAHALNRDGVHLNKRGHEMYAHALIQELSRWLPGILPT